MTAISRSSSFSLPPCLYAGDFNCHHIDWGYNNNSTDNECFSCRASIITFVLPYNAEFAASFYSGCWNTGTKADLVFAN